MEILKQYDVTSYAYNNYEAARKLPYTIMNYLFDNCDDLWKLLYYQDGTLGKPKVSNSIKKKMIAKTSEGNLDDYQVFFQFYTSDSTSKSNAQLRIQIISAESINRTDVICRIGFQCISDNKTMILSTDTSPVDNRAFAMAQSIIECLNGQQLECTKTPLFIDKSEDRYTNVAKQEFNNNYSGYVITMSCYI